MGGSSPNRKAFFQRIYYRFDLHLLAAPYDLTENSFEVHQEYENNQRNHAQTFSLIPISQIPLPIEFHELQRTRHSLGIDQIINQKQFMSEEQELDWGVGAQLLYYMQRATKDCAQRCNVLKLDREFGDSERECLRKCAIFHAGSTSTHMRFFQEFADQQYLHQ